MVGVLINLVLKMSKYLQIWKNAYWLRSFDFKGKTNRKEFWQVYFITAIINLVLVIVCSILGNIPNIGALFPFLLYLYVFVSLVPGTSISIRRIQDIGKYPEWILIGLIPLVGPLLLLFWFCRPSK